MRKSKKLLKLIFATMFVILFASAQLSGQKIDVWDFGAEQLDTAIYSNKLDSATINSWYPLTVTPGSSGATLPRDTMYAGILSYTSNGTNDRIRTTNTKLTRYDANIASVIGYTGRLYVNSAAATGRFILITLNEDDEITMVEKTDAGGRYNFIYLDDPAAQTDVITVTSNLDTLSFVAKAAGTYKIYDNLGKPSYYRIFRKAATYITINGTVDTSAAPGIYNKPGYGINFKNAAGKTWNAIVSGTNFSITVPAGYTYSLNLSDANGYIISNGLSLAVTEATSSYNVKINKIELHNATGAITGLDSAQISKMTLVYATDTADHKFYVPLAVLDAGAKTYSVQLEENTKYYVSFLGLNDYYLVNDTMIMNKADTTVALVILPKPVYNVSLDITGLTEQQLLEINLKFTNLNEAGYSYNFDTVGGIKLRDGVYSVICSGLDKYPVQQALTSNLKIEGAAANKAITFSPTTVWSFDDKEFANGSVPYKGIVFSGTVKTENKGHLVASANSSLIIPVGTGKKIKVSYYYSAGFKFNTESDTIKTSSGSTSLIESVDRIALGYDTINVLSTTYITEISIGDAVAYEPIIYVGTDKEYKTINAALDAIGQMTRDATQRVTVMIDPGNYEEMLVVTSANITLKNAAAKPSIALANKGVDIDANAVRITSYYGHGYNYYSMGTNQKWNASVLQVNKENGYTSYTNAGSGTTNGSYWNATIVVNANGFEAEDIIFENSFNQYISKKESEDVVVMWEVGNKGLRPTDIGNTGVQNRSFVERAAAIAIPDKTDKVILKNCRVIGRQDSFYGGKNSRVVIYKGAVMGAVDYLFGGMVAVFYKTNLVMNTSDVSGDATYFTAAQQDAGRGFLMYECNIKSAIPQVESASDNYCKPGYFGRPWQPLTSEVVFYKTTIDSSKFPGSVGKSLIEPAGWNNSLGGESSKMYERSTIEKSGEDNSASRATWATLLTKDTLSDGTAITTFNFTKGTDNWDPIPALVAADTVKVEVTVTADNKSKVYGTANPELTFAYSGFRPYEDTYNLTSLATVSTSATETSGAGEYAITASGAAGENYTFKYVDGTLTVSKAALTATADNKTREFGQVNPEFTISYTGFVNGDDASDITAPNASCTATETSVAGDYDIVLSGGSASNYELTLVNGTLTITPLSGMDEMVVASINVFPNPASEILNISEIPSGTETIFILDSKGQIVLEEVVISESTLLDVSSLTSGLYVIKINQQVYKLIIK